MQIKLLVEGQESGGLSRLRKFSCSYNDRLLRKLIQIPLSEQFVLLSLFISMLHLLLCFMDAASRGRTAAEPGPQSGQQALLPAPCVP